MSKKPIEDDPYDVHRARFADLTLQDYRVCKAYGRRAPVLRTHQMKGKTSPSFAVREIETGPDSATEGHSPC